MGQRRGKGKGKSRLRRPKGEKNNNPPAAGSSSSLPPPPPWIELPRDVTANILRRLSPDEIVNTADRVCTTWRSVCGEPSLWRVIHMRYTNTLYEFGRADNFCRRAVDRSQGELIDVNIKYFGNDDLLRYISEESSHLKNLSLESCGDISPGGLTTAVKKLFSLKELHIFFPQEFSDLDIETIAVSCPRLKSFTFNIQHWGRQGIDNSLALSIGKNMPNLQRLCIVGNNMDNEGLLAILDGCSNLEVLDLLRCFNLDVRSDLLRRCAEQVKEFRHPFEFATYCKWDARLYGIENEDDCYDRYYDESYDDYSDIFVGYGMGYSDYGDDWLYDPA